MRSRTIRALAFLLFATAAGCESATEPSPDAFRATWDGDRFEGSASAYVRGTELELLGWQEEAGREGIGVRIHITDFAGEGGGLADGCECRGGAALLRQFLGEGVQEERTGGELLAGLGDVAGLGAQVAPRIVDLVEASGDIHQREAVMCGEEIE